MTETDWTTCSEPGTMLDFLRNKASDRKSRLFAVACCRRLWHLLTDERSRRAIECAERYAEGVAAEEERLHCFALARDAENDARHAQFHAIADSASRATVDMVDSLGILRAAAEAAVLTCAETPVDASRLARWASAKSSRERGNWESHYAFEQEQHAVLLRCIVGNPFHPVRMEDVRLTGTVKTLATGIHDDHAFDRLPILADALEEAGCSNADILSHCRQPGIHARGCWVVDGVLGKE